MEKSENRASGRAGESIACGWLEKNGYTILHRNYYVGHDEIDIICEDEKYIVFVEVKMRTECEAWRKKYGRPASAVNYEKRKHVAAAAAGYLRSEKPGKTPRIDVIEITDEVFEGFHICSVHQIRNAFGAGGEIV